MNTSRTMESFANCYNKQLTNQSTIQLTSNLARNLLIIFFTFSLLACSDPELTKKTKTDKFTTLNDGVEEILEIDRAKWDAVDGTLTVTGEYNGDISADTSVTIIIHDQQPPKTVFGSTQVNSINSDWEVKFDDLADVPCAITAMFEDQSISDIMVSVPVDGGPDCVTPANTPPIAAMMPNTDQTITSPATIDFMDNMSSDPDGNTPLKYRWTFNGGSPASSTTPNQAVRYETPGIYRAELVVTDSTGLASDPVSIRVTVNSPAPTPIPVNDAPIAVITPASDQTIDTSPANNTISFSSMGSEDPNGDPITFSWEFQGGSPTTSMLAAETVTYSSPGTFPVKLTVTDDAGLATSISIMVTVTDPNPVPVLNDAPIAVITPASDQTIDTSPANNTISFSSMGSQDPNGDPITFSWEFQGGSPATSMLAAETVTYSSPGTFSAKLTVTDDAGLATSISIMVTVTTPAPGTVPTVISMIVLNDLHAHLTLHDDLQRNADGTVVSVQRGGLARIATEVNMIRMDNPNSILMNIGDTFHGGVEAFYSDGSDIVAPVNALGIDVGVPGNWDFTYGPNVTRARFTDGNPFIFPPRTIAKPNYPNLAANVTDIQSTLTPPTLLPETWSKTVAGVTVGIIGITSDIVPTMHPSLALGMTFLQGEANYVALIERLANDLRQQTPPADLVLVMSELGIHKDKRLADAIAIGTVDVFFSAHTHELTTTPLPSVSGALVVEAGNDTYLGRMDITVDATAGNSFDWRVLPIEATIVEYAPMKDLVDTARASYLGTGVNKSFPVPIMSAQSLTMSIDTVLATTTTLLSRRNSLESSFNNLMADMLMSANATDLAVTPGFRFDAAIMATGNITVEDVYRFFPVPYNLATANITDTDLRANIESNLTKVYSTDSFSHSGGWFDGYAGFSLAVALANTDGARITGITYNNPLIDTNIISVTGCTRPFEPSSTTFCTNGTNFTGVTTLTNAGAPLSAIDFFISQLQAGTNASFVPRQSITDSSNTPQWPISEFIQPIN